MPASRVIPSNAGITSSTTNHDKNDVTAYDNPPDNPAVADVAERNIRTILRLRTRDAVDRTIQERITDAITNFPGGWPSSASTSGSSAPGCF